MKLIVLLLMLHLCNSHPLGYILKKDDFITLKVICCGTILSEYYIMTGMHPIQMFSLAELCALGFTPQHVFKQNIRVQLRELCMPLAAIFEEGDYLRVVQTVRPIQFTYGVNVAMIPQVNSYMSPFNLSAPCYSYYHERDETKNLITNVKMIPFYLPTNNESVAAAEIVTGTYNEDDTPVYCVQDTGVAVIDRCCVTACDDHVIDAEMINFLSPVFQNVLLNYIRSEKSPAAVVFNNLTEELII